MSNRTLSEKQANQALLEMLRNPEKIRISDIENIVNSTSIDIEGTAKDARTYLYSGGVTPENELLGIKKITSEQIAIEWAKDTNGRIINDTPLAKVLTNNKIYRTALEKAFRNEHPEYPDEIIKSEMTKYMYHETKGPWANASSEYAMNIKGSVECIVPEAGKSRVWWQTELPKLLENKEVTRINGISRYEFMEWKTSLQEIGMPQERIIDFFAENIKLQSDKRLLKLDLYIDKDGELKTIDSFEFTKVRPELTETEGTYKKTIGDLRGEPTLAELRKKYPKLEELYRNTKHPDSPVMEKIHEAVKTMDESYKNFALGNDYIKYPTITEAINNLNNYNKVKGKVLKGVGVIGTVAITYDFMNTVSNAQKAYEQGNPNVGNKIIQDWLLETGGGLATANLFADIVAPFAVGAAVVGGPLGIAGGILLELGAGIVGYNVGSSLGKEFSDFLSDLFKEASEVRRIDPLVLDLNGDGIQTTALKEGVHFDLDNNTFAEKTGWISKEDGILVYDKNKNNIIDSGAELFGDQTILENGEKATGGFHALLELDKNKDGKISKEDESFADLRVWKDLNQDGISSEDELFKLSELQITAINLKNEDKNQELENGNKLLKQGSFIKEDGKEYIVGEYILARDTINTIQKEEIEILQ